MRPNNKWNCLFFYIPFLCSNRWKNLVFRCHFLPFFRFHFLGVNLQPAFVQKRPFFHKNWRDLETICLFKVNDPSFSFFFQALSDGLNLKYFSWIWKIAWNWLPGGYHACFYFFHTFKHSTYWYSHSCYVQK